MGIQMDDDDSPTVLLTPNGEGVKGNNTFHYQMKLESSQDLQGILLGLQETKISLMTYGHKSSLIL